MKKIILLTMLSLSFFANAQTATASANGTTAIAKSSTKSTKTSVSVSDSDSSYSLHASFDSWKKEKLQKLLAENLDKSLLTSTEKSMIWKKENDSETAYSFTLTNEKLKVSIDKDLVSKSTIEKLKKLGEEISETLTEK